MPKKHEGRAKGLRMRKPRSPQTLLSEQAAAYGIAIPDESQSTERFLSPNDIGKILDVTGEAVKQWIYHRRLPAVKLANGYWKVRVSDFENFLRARKEVGRRRILLTGANSDAALSQAIENLGHNALWAHNYTDAMLKASDHHPALFIILLKANEADPWKLAKKIRQTKALKNVPILFIADREPTEQEAERALELAAQGFLNQPIDPAVLTSEIKRILDRTI